MHSSKRRLENNNNVKMLKQASTYKGIHYVHPSKLRFENKNNVKMLKQAWTFLLMFLFIRDLGGIRTPNPQSRNLIFYPVELRGRLKSEIRNVNKKQILNSKF